MQEEEKAVQASVSSSTTSSINQLNALKLIRSQLKNQKTS